MKRRMKHQAAAAIPVYKNPVAPATRRVKDLLSRMTLEEKMTQLVYDSPAIERLGIPAYTGETSVCTAWRRRGWQQYSLNPSAWEPRGIQS